MAQEDRFGAHAHCGLLAALKASRRRPKCGLVNSRLIRGICLETLRILSTFLFMTFTEIKPRLDELSLEEKRKLAAYLRHSLRVDTEDNRQELARRNREMAAGKIYDLAEVKATLAKLHGTPDAG